MNRIERTVQIAFIVPENLRTALRHLAITQGRTMSQIAIEALTRAVQKESRQ